MISEVGLLGTDLKLTTGQRVTLELATNQPEDSDIVYFARPAFNAGPEWGEDYSFPIGADDVDLD